MIPFLILTLVISAAGLIPPSLSLWLIIVYYMLFNLSGGTSTAAFQNSFANVRWESVNVPRRGNLRRRAQRRMANY
jgi:hypothetical protein